MNKHRTRTLRKLLRTEPKRVGLANIVKGREYRRNWWAVAVPNEDPEFVDFHTGATRNEALRAAYVAQKESK